MDGKTQVYINGLDFHYKIFGEFSFLEDSIKTIEKFIEETNLKHFACFEVTTVPEGETIYVYTLDKELFVPEGCDYNIKELIPDIEDYVVTEGKIH